MSRFLRLVSPGPARSSSGQSLLSTLRVCHVLLLSTSLLALRVVATSQSPIPTGVLSQAAPSIQPTSTHSAGYRRFAETAGLPQFNQFSMMAGGQNNVTGVREALTPELYKGLLQFWFEGVTSDADLVAPKMDQMMRWFKGGKELDEICVARFAPALEAIRESGITSGEELLAAVPPNSAMEWLGLHILLDQVPRNCYRGESSSTVFKYFDPIARSVAYEAASQNIVRNTPNLRWSLTQRFWFYMPLMHSEATADHERAVAEFEGMKKDAEEIMAAATSDDDRTTGRDEIFKEAVKVMRDEAKREDAKTMLKGQMEFEMKHFDIIKQFGRYPHRNVAMGREPTKEEIAYLEGGGDTFAA